MYLKYYYMILEKNYKCFFHWRRKFLVIFQGNYSFDPTTKVLLWEVGKIEPTKLPNIRLASQYYLRKWTSLDVFNSRVLYNYLYQSYQKRKRRNNLKTFKIHMFFFKLCTVAWTLGQCFLSRGTVNLSAGSSPASTNPTVNVKFAISQLAVSGLKVNRLDAY